MLELVVLTLLCSSNWNYKILVAIACDGVLSRASVADRDRSIGPGAKGERS